VVAQDGAVGETALAYVRRQRRCLYGSTVLGKPDPLLSARGTAQGGERLAESWT
jgi:hypothetical protein